MGLNKYLRISLFKFVLKYEFTPVNFGSKVGLFQYNFSQFEQYNQFPNSKQTPFQQTK